MKLQLGQKTKLDPTGQLIKVLAYKVALQGSPSPSSIDKITETKLGKFSFTDAQAFVHTWFSLIDGGDADQLMTMTSDDTLDVDILGNKIADKTTLIGFLTAQGDSQNFSLHTPFNICVTKNDSGFAVRFVLNFHGDIKETGLLTLSNITNWTLIEQNGQLKLRDYTLEIL